MSEIYRLLMVAARQEGIGIGELPDFLGLERGGEFELLGQDELTLSALESYLAEKLPESSPDSPFTEQETERILLGTARVGQHLFATKVLGNCGNRCVFCGLDPPGFGGKRMLLASHIKPWRESTSKERVDHRNGLAACPTHDVAFDTGLLTVNGGLKIHTSTALADAVVRDPAAGHYFARPPMFESLVLPSGADAPAAEYLQWHKERIFRGID